MSKKQKQARKNRVIKIKPINIIALAIIVIFVATLITKMRTNQNKIDPNFVVTPEILRSREYNVVNTGDEATNSEYVKFDAFFLKDLNGDGNADSIRGTCNEIGKEDTLYMDLKVINNGYLKNGRIKINSSNFYLKTSIVKDSNIVQNYISENTRQIEINNLTNGTHKLITGIVRSGDYSASYLRNWAIGDDTTKYSKVNSIVFTGTHVAENGTETQISKTINFNVDWYGSVTSKIEITNVRKTINSIEDLIENEQLKLDFNIEVEEKQNQLILKSNYLEGTIPELNGYKPISVKIDGYNIEYTYNEETGKFTAKKEANVNENGILTESVYTSQLDNRRINKYSFEVIYPKAAYEAIENDEIEVLIPIKTWYEGFNNKNSEFTNPYISNISEKTIVARWEKPIGYAYKFGIELGKISTKPFKRKVISKEKPYKIYNRVSEQEIEDYYTVEWNLSTGSEGIANTVIMKETPTGNEKVSDSFIKTDSNLSSMENITSNVGIYFAGQAKILGEDGWIKVYNDETNELIETFTKDNWNKYRETNPYKYTTPIKHIRVETSKTSKNSIFKVFNIKELDDAYITANYTEENFKNLQSIKSNLTGYFDLNKSTVANTAYYEAPTSFATIYLQNNQISTQETTQNQTMKINTQTSSYNLQKWKNGIFLVKFPSEILKMEINNITIDNSNVNILGYDLYEEGENYFLKILTENGEETSYTIDVNYDITPDPRTTTVTRNIELYASNEIAIEYAKDYEIADTYDVNGNLNTTELINEASARISLISPDVLLTHQLAKNYNKNNSVAVAPKLAKVDKNQRTAEIEINILNNYSEDITDIKIQGVIPFENNKYVIGDGDLGSEYSTWMSNTGITVPTVLKDVVTVYYSTEERPTNDISDINNKWTLAEDVTDWSEIKTFIIDFGEYKMKHGNQYTFTYQINIPEGIDYNKVAYSEHAVYFGILTDAGKYSPSTGVNKLGFMIAKQYDLEIIKYQENTEKILPGITFKVTEDGQEESRIKVTDVNGKINISELASGKVYTIKEIKTTEDYILNEEEIKIYTYVDENDILHLTYKNDDGVYSDLTEKYSWIKSAELTKNENEDYKAQIALENEVKPKLKIVKFDKTSNEKLTNIVFKIRGEGVNTATITDSNGEAILSGLHLNKEYEITETKKWGYYELPPIKFKIINNNGTYSAEIIEGNVKSQSIETVDYIPQLNLELENEKIPTYNLEITKIEEKHSEKTLKNAEFILKGEDDHSQKKLITNESGKAQVENLYQFINGKAITGKYTLQETNPPIGYSNSSEEISFVVSKNGENLEVNVENESNLTSFKSAEVDGNTVKLVLQDKPLFKLTKTDKETGAPLANAKFIIYEIDEDGTELDFAKDVNGNYIGILNEKNQYEVITDENGEIAIPLRNGIYKSIEIEAPTGYERNPAEEIFKITSNEAEQEIGTEDEFENTLKINYIEDLVNFAENVSNGNTYSGTKVILERTLDFSDSNSYRNANDTDTYGDYNEDGETKTIKEELTTGSGFKGIGIFDNIESNAHPFSGIFDGQENEINGIYMKSRIYIALFNYVKDGKIKRLMIDGEVIGGSACTAGLVAYGDNIEIYSCHNKCNIDSNGNYHASGILCYGTNDVRIEDCHNNGNIKAGGQIGAICCWTQNCKNILIKSCTNNVNLNLPYYSGAIFSNIGASESANVNDCQNYGEITATYGNYIGGIGARCDSCNINNCINYGNIYSSVYYIGGIISSNASRITNCINYGNIQNINNTQNVGGIAGQNVATIEDCINYGEIYAGSGYSSYISGISGQDSNVKRCANYGDIYGKSYVGGITGSGGNIIDSYNRGNIYGNEYSSQICFNGSVENTYSTRKDV